MTEEEKKYLEDIKGFIDWSIDNDHLFEWVLSNMGHDVNAFLSGEISKGRASPRTEGYAKFQRRLP
jgi:hypothetical protein